MNTSGYTRPKYNVPINIEERDDCYRLTVYATGFPKDRITTVVTNDVLTIRGERDYAEEAHIEFIKQEFPVKSFERSLHLNGMIETDCISSRFEEGVLTVFLPKKQETTLRHIRKQLDIAILG
ncbi:heat-shock protein Hsp20 [Niabella ginsenosidivorans]|uniref:Heat-shock protein Hsp20 n=1 Tax=Niabella ginsenosidivorans TaxID=1176587 RepID=A0A1A9I868_9BACT|nr:Hsp20/alpha crystallin family protein [Niabella ginsenosidivorans]ANH82890.1 heat-shock protein Hsp20 [Niabella ginsenosidivorans]